MKFWWQRKKAPPVPDWKRQHEIDVEEAVRSRAAAEEALTRARVERAVAVAQTDQLAYLVRRALKDAR